MISGRSLIRAVVAAVALSTAWVTTVSGGSTAPDVLPTTSVEFSLDMRVLTTVDAPTFWAVEQRARPGYRIFSYDPASGTDETVYTVPVDAIIYGIDVDSTASTIAVAWSPDHALGGSGLALLDLTTGHLAQIVPVTTDVFLTEPEWTPDGTAILATRVDRTGELEQLDVVAVSLDGTVRVVAEGAVTPAASDETIHYLDVEEASGARRTIRSVDLATEVDEAVATGSHDLDHLVTDDSGLLRVAALTTDDPVGGLNFGAPALAHGSHDVPSTWWDLSTRAEQPIEPTTTYDVTSSNGVMVLATLEGLSLIDGDQKVDLVASRAMRFVTTA